MILLFRSFLACTVATDHDGYDTMILPVLSFVFSEYLTATVVAVLDIDAGNIDNRIVRKQRFG